MTLVMRAKAERSYLRSLKTGEHRGSRGRGSLAVVRNWKRAVALEPQG